MTHDSMCDIAGTMLVSEAPPHPQKREKERKAETEMQMCTFAFDFLLFFEK